MRLFGILIYTALASVPQVKIGFGKGGGVASLQLHREQEFKVMLVTHPSTGYDWTLSAPLPECIELLCESYRSLRIQPRVVGSHSVVMKTFKATGVCSGLISYEYTRPSERGSARNARTTITVSVS